MQNTWKIGIKKYKVEKEEKNSLKAGKQYSVSSKSGTAYDALWSNQKEAFNDFKRRVFNCTAVKYNKLGRVEEMIFEEQAINYSEGIQSKI